MANRKAIRAKVTDPAESWLWYDLPRLGWYGPYLHISGAVSNGHRRLNPHLRAKLLVADVDCYYFKRNRPVPEFVNNYLRKYFTPAVDEPVESCSTEIGRDFGRITGLARAKKIDFRNGDVFMDHGGIDAFQCVDPIGWRRKYLREDDSPNPDGSPVR